MGKVYIVAGGPGDPDLITVKGQKIIKEADIIFTGKRFFEETMFAAKKKNCEVLEHFDTTYDEKLAIIKESIGQGKIVAFINMGDPCLYGMCDGLFDRLDKANIDYEVVPGVSAFNASCAIIKKQMTGLSTSNTAICTTYKDHDDAKAYLNQIAALGASVALFMSVDEIEEICEIFGKHYPQETPVVVVAEASRPAQKIIKGDLQSITGLIREANVDDGLILLGEFINKPYDYEIEKEFMEKRREEIRLRKAKQ